MSFLSFDGAKVRLFFHSRNTFRPLFAIKAPIVDIRHSTPTVVDIGQCESIYLNTETLRYRVYIISFLKIQRENPVTLYLCVE